MPRRSPKLSTNLLSFHRPRASSRASMSEITQAPIPKLTTESERCLRNLASYKAPKSKLAFPRSKSAAVLVALFVGRQGDLYVLLSRRSSTLRTYAGDTSLPGGKVDPVDESLEDTARREAFEEIGLPRDPRKVPLLCITEPFLAAELVVTPVVVLILDNTLQPMLNTAEVASLFSHPLASFLSTEPPFPNDPDTLEMPYHTSYDYPPPSSSSSSSSSSSEVIPNPNRFRVHRFLTGREAGGVKPVFGLTAAMCINVACIGYKREPSFELHAPGSPSTEERLAWALVKRPSFLEACVKEGVDLGYARRVVRGLERRKERYERQKEEQREMREGVKSKL